ncbi:MAG TPA: hypothetical protein VGH64_08650 [Puia sp.]
MKFYFSLLLFCFFYTSIAFSQAVASPDSLINKISDSLIKKSSADYAKNIRDSVVKNVKDSLFWTNLEKTATYPVIKNSKWSGVFAARNVTEKPDATMKYKLLFNMTIWSKDSTGRRKLNEGLAEIGRIINLHVASGVPRENLELAIVIHGGAMNTYLKNEAFHKKFQTDNPNLDILKQFTDLHASLMACGQAEIFFRIPAEDMIPEVKTAFSAQVVLSTYQLKGYVLYNIEEEK